jgi:flagellar basal-body rod protein FlgB
VLASTTGFAGALKIPPGKVETVDMTVKPAQFDLLQQLLTLSDVRQHVISQNVANVNTPGYQRLDISFEETLSQLLEDGEKGRTAEVEPVIREAGGAAVRADGNNVDIDREMGALNRNALIYQTYAQVLASRLATMRSAITGR